MCRRPPRPTRTYILCPYATLFRSGSLSYLNFADRRNWLPLGISGIALGTAILPMLSRYIGSEDRKGADLIQSNAIELAMLLTLPAAAALAVCAAPFVNAFFLGGRFNAADATITANVVVALVTGLPAYVLIKVLTPSYFARKDTRTPVRSEEHTSELQSLMRITYAVFCLKKKKTKK